MSKDFSEWLKKERQARGLSIRQLSSMTTFSHSQIAKVERDEVLISWDFCAAMAKVFNQPVWKLFILANLIPNVPEEAYTDEKLRVLMNSFGQLPENGKDELLRYASWLVHQHTNKPE